MIRNEIIHNPVTGETLYVLESTDEVFRFEFEIDPGCEIAAEHVHPELEQTIRVVEGELRCRMEGVERTLTAGESVVVPAGTAHFQWNPTNTTTRAIEEYRPAGDAHNFFRVAFGLARDGHTDRKGVPKPLIGAALLSEFDGFVRPTSIYLRILFRVLGPVSRLLGYDCTIAKYLARFEKQDTQVWVRDLLEWWYPSTAVCDPEHRTAEEAFWR